MKLVWCPETAGKAHIDTVKTLAVAASSPLPPPPEDNDVAELVAAMAGGWRAQCIVESWSQGHGVATSIGLATAARHTGARHVCVVPDEKSRTEYLAAMKGTTAGVEMLVGEAEEVMEGVPGVDFAVVDVRRKEGMRVLRAARLGARGAVLVCKGSGGGRWRGVLMAGTRVVRSAVLPIGRGVEIVHVGVGKGPKLGDRSRWIKHVDRNTGEEHVFRRCSPLSFESAN